ncbi:phospholipase A2, minor isoenzyme-like [Spea bombifrons]|uniref:phospholipase A2, minor isoenzyme-like n=1 Tax=Spea bombifrons TaxID=233779 RepID=UPI0023492323|nr:phospholipase A2, minor isoenzyme-like [Spea bombifrons]
MTGQIDHQAVYVENPISNFTVNLPQRGCVFTLSGVSSSLLEFLGMLKCMIPDNEPLLDYNNYGCYCGFLGSGTPVDELDRCCYNHDNCYGEYQTVGGCKSTLQYPYMNFYSYTCVDKEVTCKNANNPCEMFICECDRTAAICFSQATYNEENKNLDTTKHCQ